MEINNITIGDAKEIARMFDGNIRSAASETSIEIGKSYAFRTVTHYYTGRVIAITSTDFVLELAAWIADTGRWTQFLLDPNSASEIEIFPKNCILMRGGIIDVSEIPVLPRNQK